MELTLNQVSEGVAVLVVDGRVDQPTWEYFSATLLRCAKQVAAGGVVLLDMSGTTYFSSRGLRALTLTYKACQPRDVRLAICGAQGMVREIFEISRYDALFEVFPSIAAARAELG